MNIALVGYGRMGKMIEGIARERGHNICCIIDVDNQRDFDSEAFRKADVAIEFSVPSTAVANIEKCFGAGVPVVSGTTGWNKDMPAVEEKCLQMGGSILTGSNFSIGVNVFMAVNRYLAGIMNAIPEYDAELCETHHIHKLDHPSGTAITLADQLVERVDRIERWAEPCAEQIKEGVMPVNFMRRGEVPGIHTITWESDFDSITLTHSARTRAGFALGAVLAAEWLPGHKGVFGVGDMLTALTGLRGIFK